VRLLPILTNAPNAITGSVEHLLYILYEDQKTVEEAGAEGNQDFV
jgi:hypothetical protein